MTATAHPKRVVAIDGRDIRSISTFLQAQGATDEHRHELLRQISLLTERERIEAQETER